MLLTKKPSDSVERKRPVLTVFIPLGERMNASPAPTRKNCGISAKTRITSTTAAATMPAVDRISPSPINCKSVNPATSGINSLNTQHSFTVIRIAPTKKTVSDPAGISKWPIDLRMVDACSTEKVIICAYVVQKMMVVAHTGSSLIIIFTSSILVTEQSFHGFGNGAPWL
ncbi:unnamed protein product [Spirodela intermedia]|uniref:Uncharacterized protein n=1 Tax=Spirodela intermedia TaxID=51605 RepID=A0A7I8JNN0_SPIIN|nr:unnamed protein product [Spirodela intermedia]CAA6671756.1 unnamed protein product [Spirodela intermedia]